MLVLVPFVAVVALLANSSRPSALDFHADGFVNQVNWEGKNHGAALIIIRQKNGSMKKFESTKIVLNKFDVKVGDYFSKASGEWLCYINNNPIRCITND